MCVSLFFAVGSNTERVLSQSRGLMEGPGRPIQNKYFKTFILPSDSINICIPLMQKILNGSAFNET